MFDAPPRRTDISNAKLEFELSAATLLDADWQSWFFATLAFLYGLAVLIAVIVLLVKSAKGQK
jgi:hypothetical protein